MFRCPLHIPWSRIAAVALLLCAAAPLAAGELETRIAAGNQFYEQQRYDSALQEYQAVPAEAAASPFLRYNVGNTFYQQGKFDAAVDEYRQVFAAEHPGLNRFALYNAGCAQYRMADQKIAEQNLQEALPLLQACVESFKHALREFPGDADIKHNYSQALRKLKELEQQQQQQQQQDQNQEDQQRENQDQQQDQKQQQRCSECENQDQQCEQCQERQQQQQQQQQQEEQQQQGEKQQEQQQQQQSGSSGQEQQQSEGGQQQQDQAAGQPSEEELQQAAEEMARMILENLFDDSQLKELDRLYRPAKRPGRAAKDW